ncbi:MAG: nucleoside triphosphate pyrophosphohydrolase [Candidatus Tectomicrobia bacterium]|nr:nucleoside triphosphate pyrophosphohydrolase [Candidatus Tectomicrobia bacterium]
MSAADHHQPAPASATELAEHFLQLLAIVDRLRSPQGCPWDRQQTPQSLIPYLLEETYEVIESIEEGNHNGLKEELGDLLLHILFQGQLAQEHGRFTLDDSIQAISEKLIRRHPHVFGDVQRQDETDINRNWEAAKQREKGRKSLLDGVPRSLPALARARRVQEKAASAGFDWPSIGPVWDKVNEEMEELRQACAAGTTGDIEEEFGDVLFSLVNLSRFLRLNADGSMRQAIDKFERRFHGIEAELTKRGRRLEEVNLEEMDAIWNELRQQDRLRPQ